MFDIPGFGDEIAAELGLDRRGGAQPLRAGGAHGAREPARDLVLELSADRGRRPRQRDRRAAGAPLVRVFEVPEPVGLWTTVLVYFPRSRFTAELPERLADTVADAYGADQRTFESFVRRARWRASPSACAAPTADSHVDLDALERTIDEQSTSWTDRLRAALVAELGEAHGHRLFELAGAARPPAYRAAVAPERAVADLRRVAECSPGDDDLAVALGHDVDAQPGEWRFRVYRRGTPMALAELLPLLDHLGFVPSTSSRTRSDLDGERVHLYDIGVRVPDGVVLDEPPRRRRRSRRSSAWSAATIESDGFNRLVLVAGLDAREVAMLRAYAKYLRQIGFAVQPAVHRGRRWPATRARRLARRAVRRPLRPAPSAAAEERDAAATVLRAQIVSALDAVPSLDEDRICRAFLTLIDATVRTNVFRRRDRRSRSSSTRRRSRTCRCRARCTRSGCARRGSRVCTCAAGRSPAAACAGATAARTSAPRCSA